MDQGQAGDTKVKKYTFAMYQQQAARTMNNVLGIREMEAANYAMGLAGESGETVDYLKKVLFHGHMFDRDVLAKELGDSLWYINAIATLFGIDLEDIAKQNVAKLLKRYPDGFDPNRSKERTE